LDMDMLFGAAERAALASYSPYSHFRVGAALLCYDGSVVVGTNVENRSYGLTICAERSAVAAGISAGKRQFIALALSTPDSAEPVGPCGACRQVLSEFMAPDAPIRFKGAGPGAVDTTMGALVPFDSLHDLAKQS
jgi:cytidine deaminase